MRFYHLSYFVDAAPRQLSPDCEQIFVRPAPSNLHSSLSTLADEDTHRLLLDPGVLVHAPTPATCLSCPCSSATAVTQLEQTDDRPPPSGLLVDIPTLTLGHQTCPGELGEGR